ncbi:MAG: hypothetical protein ACYDA8_06660 [Deferrisomatales bacterium]
MLNELLAVERGVVQSGIETARLHPDVKECGRIPTLLVRLLVDGRVSSVRPLPQEARPWTLRDGQQNSFPFVQPRSPLLLIPDGNENREIAVKRRSEGRRAALLTLCKEMGLNPAVSERWPTANFVERQQERRTQFAALAETDAQVVLATIDSFVAATDLKESNGASSLVASIVRQLMNGLEQNVEDDWVEVAASLLIGKFYKKKNEWECAGGLLFEAEGSSVRVFDPRVALLLSAAFGASVEATANSAKNVACALTGAVTIGLSGNFPQPNLPVLGQTFLFAKNKEIRASHRYNRFAADAMPVGQRTAEELAAALKALTAEERRGKTWTDIPGEAAKDKDLLLAFVEAVPDAPAAGALADDGDDYSEEIPAVKAATFDSVAAFEKRAERVIDAVRARLSDFHRTPVHLAVFRKVDPANRKVVYSGAPTVGELHQAAAGWVAGERNVPPWLSLPVLRNGERWARPMSPPHLAPLGLISFSRQLFVRQGAERQEVPGMPAADAMGLFLDPAVVHGSPGRRRASRLLQLVLIRRAMLVSGAAHAQRSHGKTKRGALEEYDGREVLRTTTVMGMLLHKLGRKKEEYMSDTAFKLGQLLAAADVVHAGYCADVRGGSVPPSLLGNQVFTMAQSTPAKALATLCRRWKPYGGWAKKAESERGRVEKMVSSKSAGEQQRGWEVKKALRHAREMKTLADELGPTLSECKVDDAFRAELLLGYIAGLPKAQEQTDRSQPTTD